MGQTIVFALHSESTSVLWQIDFMHDEVEMAACFIAN